MTCTYLTGNSILSCRARSGVYVPSLGELRQFCMNTGHLCPAQSAEEAGGAGAIRSAGCWPGNERPQRQQRPERRGRPAA